VHNKLILIGMTQGVTLVFDHYQRLLTVLGAATGTVDAM
jgi:hypothetical protein